MKIKIVENGPIVLDSSEAFAINAGAAHETKAGPLYLCRCGQSANKPFCDGTHRRVKFEGKGGELSCA